MPFERVGNNDWGEKCMREKLEQLLRSEDPKNPYTDEQLAKLLSVRRDEITSLRLQLGVANSRERRKSIFLQSVQAILNHNPDASIREITRRMQNQGYTCSKHIVDQAVKELRVPMPKDAVLVDRLPMNNDPFHQIVGYNGSLRTQIQQAKAVVVYPAGLHAIICGATGTGKSLLAEAMYHYGIQGGYLPQDAPFVVFNCAEYADNPQLLHSHLFGHARGSFTGAVADKAGLVELADGGILFLDEVHRLGPEGQEQLFCLIDKGQFRRLGETSSKRSARVLIIAATTESLESSLLPTFRRRIPMTIELPTLAQRPPKERSELIYHLFQIEARRTHRIIRLSREAHRALLLYACPGNVGQLHSDICVICANGFLNAIINSQEQIYIDYKDLPGRVQTGFLQTSQRSSEVEKLVSHDLEIRETETVDGWNFSDEEQDEDTYRYIEKTCRQLEAQGLKREIINDLISKELRQKLTSASPFFENRSAETNYLLQLAGEEAVHGARNIIVLAEKHLGTLQKQLLVLLAFHLSGVIRRAHSGIPIVNPQREQIREQYPAEFAVAQAAARMIEQDLCIPLPEDEIAFLAMYLYMGQGKSQQHDRHIRILVLTHGRTAEALCEVANHIMGSPRVDYIEMSLDEPPATALERAIQKAQEIDEGKGILLLADMGSTMSFGDIITSRTHIPTATVPRVDIMMLLTAIQKSSLPGAELQEVAKILKKNNCFSALEYRQPARQKLILCVCLTGKGTALTLKHMLQKQIPKIEEQAHIETLSVLNEQGLVKRIRQFQQDHQIVAVVGPYCPEGLNIPFFSVEDIISNRATQMLQFLLEESPSLSYLPEPIIHSDAASLQELVHLDLISLHATYSDKLSALEGMARILTQRGYTQEGYIVDVLRREVIAPTGLQNGFAVPHGCEKNVNRSVVAVSVLDRPIPWSESLDVDVIVMIALNGSGTVAMEELSQLLLNPAAKEALIAADSAEQVAEIVAQYAKIC